MTFCVFSWCIEDLDSGCSQCDGTCVFILCLQMKTGGVWNKGMALKRHLSGPLRGRISPSSQIATFLGTSLPPVSKAWPQSGVKELLFTLILTFSHTTVSAFQRSSWASRC